MVLLYPTLAQHFVFRCQLHARLRAFRLFHGEWCLNVALYSICFIIIIHTLNVESHAEIRMNLFWECALKCTECMHLVCFSLTGCSKLDKH